MLAYVALQYLLNCKVSRYCFLALHGNMYRLDVPAVQRRMLLGQAGRPAGLVPAFGGAQNILGLVPGTQAAASSVPCHRYSSIGSSNSNSNNSNALRSQKAVYAYLQSEHILPFAFARQHQYAVVVTSDLEGQVTAKSITAFHIRRRPNSLGASCSSRWA